MSEEAPLEQSWIIVADPGLGQFHVAGPDTDIFRWIVARNRERAEGRHIDLWPVPVTKSRQEIIEELKLRYPDYTLSEVRLVEP